MNPICPKCKRWDPGKCKDSFCPVRAKISAHKQVLSSSKQDFFGKSPTVFVGRFGYPNVNVGFLSTEQYDNNDEPLLWSKEGYSIDRIVGLRSSLINSNFKSQVKTFNDRLVEMGREVGMASKPVDTEISLTKKPSFALSMGAEVMPHGPNVKLKSARITENPKIPIAVDKAVSDSGLKAGQALGELYRKSIDEHHLSRLLSTGNLGVRAQRKLVPTRWSITAVDDTLGKKSISEIMDLPSHDLSVFFGGFLGNYYIVILFPDIWGYELFETHTGNDLNVRSSYMTDYENHNGRKEYAFDTAGGYYAARLGVLEYLKQKRRQASALLLRFITDEYYLPLGVWVVREAVRKAMQSKPMVFDSRELALNYAKALAKKNFGMDAGILIQKSLLLNEAKSQPKLSGYF